MTKKYLWGTFLIVLAIIGFFIPFAILFFTKYDEWVVTADTTSISTGVMIGLVYGVVVLRGGLKRMSPELITFMSMFVMLLIVWFLDSILEDLFFIILSFIAGYTVFLVLSKWGARQIELAKSYGDETYRAKARADYLNNSNEVSKKMRV